MIFWDLVILFYAVCCGFVVACCGEECKLVCVLRSCNNILCCATVCTRFGLGRLPTESRQDSWRDYFSHILPPSKSSFAGRLAWLFIESRRPFWYDSMKSHGKPNGATTSVTFDPQQIWFGWQVGVTLHRVAPNVLARLNEESRQIMLQTRLAWGQILAN